MGQNQPFHALGDWCEYNLAVVFVANFLGSQLMVADLRQDGNVDYDGDRLKA